MPETEKKPMISADYRKAYAAKGPDWVKSFVAKHCYAAEELPEGSKKKPKMVADIDAMVALASVNGLDVSKFNSDAYNTGQKIMNINNVLRAAAKKRHGLKGPNERFVSIPADDPLIAGTEPTEDKNGNSLKPKAEKKAA
jgi:hypothetical protein